MGEIGWLRVAGCRRQRLDHVAARQAPAAYIGPTQYSQMIWAVLLGYVLFGDGVDLPMVAGIVLIVASGLLTLIRENVRGTPLPPSVAGERHVAAALVPEAGNPRHQTK